jgi:hypothetical protein
MSSTSSRPAAKEPFFIIGAQRCGTTYLHELLDEHPDVAMAKPKKPEPKWFLDPVKAALGREAWETRLFPGTRARVLGEKGTSYIEHPEAAGAILGAFPEARFIVVIRDPIARAVSNYRFSVANGLESLPIERALTPEAEERAFDGRKISASPFFYLRRGRYAQYLEAWAGHVPGGRIHVVALSWGSRPSGQRTWSASSTPPQPRCRKCQAACARD